MQHRLLIKENIVNFEEWLTITGVPTPSIKKFMDAINGPLSMFFDLQYLGAGSLCDIRDLAIFNKINEKFESDKDFQTRNKRGNNIYRETLEKYREFLISLTTSSVGKELGPHLDQVRRIAESRSVPPYMPFDQNYGVVQILSDVIRRRGEHEFRENLLNIYNYQCAITGSNLIGLLEVTHITPFPGSDCNRPQNCLILRSDIHTLWDLGLIAIDPKQFNVWVHPNITDSAYRALVGTIPFIPKMDADRPSSDALQKQWSITQLKDYA